MSGTDWLRALVKRGRTPATGGLVTPDRAAIVVGPAGYLVPTAVAEQAAPMPIAVVEIGGTVTEADAAQIRQQLQITPRPFRSEPMRCPCVAIYSECRCSGTNISAQTKAADFRAGQQ